MDTAHTEILPGEGLGQIRFGMSRDDLKNLLGDPDEVETGNYDDGEGDGTESWHYDELGASFGFDEEDDWQLVTLAVSADHYTFRDAALIHSTRENLIQELENIGFVDLEFEDWSTDDNPNHHLIRIDGLELNFWLDDSVLTEIQWGPFFDSDDEIIWPEED